MIDEKLARRRYHMHKCVAKQRNVPFELTYDEWITIWLKSGKYELRGYGKGKYCMSRFNDTGPYSVGNVFIQLHTQNQIDGVKGRKKTEQHIINWRKSWYNNKKSANI
jgi:hypothetical protein